MSQLDLDMGNEYFCVVCECRHDGKECPKCGRHSHTLAADMRVKEVVVPVTHKLYFRKGSLNHVLAMVHPKQHVIGWSAEFGDYRLEAISAKDTE